MTPRRLTWLAFILAVMLAAGVRSASAHQPTFNSDGSPTPESAFVIEDVGLSLALFGSLQEAGSVDYYRLDVPAGHVNRCAALRAHGLRDISAPNGSHRTRCIRETSPC